jgi:hypothetical protein
MRGSVAGEPIVSQAQTREFDEGYARTFGERKPSRGRWVYDAQGNAIPAGEYVAPSEARTAPVMVDRFMEGASSIDGVDLGSRAKRKEYMRRTGVADSSDYPKKYCEARRAAKDSATSEATKRAVVEVSKIDRRHLPKFIEEGKKR